MSEGGRRRHEERRCRTERRRQANAELLRDASWGAGGAMHAKATVAQHMRTNDVVKVDRMGLIVR